MERVRRSGRRGGCRRCAAVALHGLRIYAWKFGKTCEERKDYNGVLAWCGRFSVIDLLSTIDTRPERLGPEEGGDGMTWSSETNSLCEFAIGGVSLGPKLLWRRDVLARSFCIVYSSVLFGHTL